MRRTIWSNLLLTCATCGLAACGGGGGGGGVGGIASTPTPASIGAPVTIFLNPSPAEYASVGASISGPGGNLDTYASQDTRFGAISSVSADQPLVRYVAGGYYEVKMPGADWDRLITYKGFVPQDPANNNYFQPASVAQNYGYLVTEQSRKSGYSYSELAGWGSSAASRWGYVAFGAATPGGGVPVTGSASYNGTITGSADVMTADTFYGGYVTSPVTGTVNLTFDFGAGTLAGSMSAFMSGASLGSFAFKDTVFAAGSTVYSGKFDTTVAGQNFFLGRFTGPHAEETIGAWALPFVFTGDGQNHQAFGAWIAKRGP